MFPEWIEVFSTGKWTDSQGNTKDWTLDDLNEIASSYNVKNPAPIVIGHPEIDSPAYGWIEALKIEGEKLLAKPGQLVEEFVDWVKRGLYKKISVAIYPDLTLKHVGFLGGAAPAVKGLRPVSFGDKKAGWTFERETTLSLGESTSQSDRDDLDKSKKGGNAMEKFKEFLQKMIAMFSQAEKDLSASGDIHVTNADLRFSEAEVQAREAKAKKDAEIAAFAENEKLKKEKAEAEAKVKQIGDEKRKSDIASFCEGLCKEGKLTPALRKIIEPVMIAVSDPSTGSGQESLIEFAEGVKKTRLDGIKDFLTELPKVVTFREVTPKTGPNAGDSAGEKIKKLVDVKLEAKKDLTYSAAFSEVQMENPELAKEYLAEINPNK